MKPEEIETLKPTLDPHNKGMVEFGDFAHLGGQIVFSNFLKSQVDFKIRNKDEEFLFEANMVLYNHPIHKVLDKIVQRLNQTEEQEPKIPFEEV